MWINAAPDGYEVMSVVSGSPAEMAGIAVGDTIISLDGQQAVAEKLSDARMLLRSSPAGSTLHLIVRRGENREVALMLRDQI